MKNRKIWSQKKKQTNKTKGIFFYLLVSSQIRISTFYIQNKLHGSLVILNNVLLRLKLCVEIFFVFIYLLSWAQLKILVFESTDKFQTTRLRQCKIHRIHEIIHVTESAKFLKKCSYKKTECCIKWTLFHCYVIALAQRGNNSTFLFLYTLRYF